MNYNYKQFLIRSFFFVSKRQEWDGVSSNPTSYSRDVTSLTDGNLFDELGGGMSPLHQGSRPWRQIPVGLHSKHVGLDAPSRARPSGEDQLGALGGRTPGAARMDQPGGGGRQTTLAESVLTRLLTSHIITLQTWFRFCFIVKKKNNKKSSVISRDVQWQFPQRYVAKNTQTWWRVSRLRIGLLAPLLLRSQHSVKLRRERHRYLVASSGCVSSGKDQDSLLHGTDSKSRMSFSVSAMTTGLYCCRPPSSWIWKRKSRGLPENQSCKYSCCHRYWNYLQRAFHLLLSFEWFDQNLLVWGAGQLIPDVEWTEGNTVNGSAAAW